MEFTIANQIMRNIQAGAKRAFMLRKQSFATHLCFGAAAVPDVNFLLWLNSPQVSQFLSSSIPTADDFTLIFDGYGADPKRVRFALIKGEQVVLDSDAAGVTGLFSIHTQGGHAMPLCILGLINHWGEDPSSIFLADRSEDLILFAGNMAQTIQVLAGGTKNE